MIYNVCINSVITKKLNIMNRVHEIIGHLTDEETHAVLYGVMLSVIEKRAKNDGGDTYQYSLRVCEKTKTLDLFVDAFHSTDTILIEEYGID